MTDKAVSTEDLCAESPLEHEYLSIVRMEAFLNTLVENKVESLKNDNRKSLSAQSSPKNILNRLRFTSSPSINIKSIDEATTGTKRKQKQRRTDNFKHNSKNYRKSNFRKEPSVSSNDSQHYQCKVRTFNGAIEQACNKAQLQTDSIICIDDNCSGSHKNSNCYCQDFNHAQIVQYEDDYISLKIDGYGEETDRILAEEAVRRARRKRRRRRKKRMKKKRMGMNVVIDPVHLDDRYKVINSDDLPQRARWTIVATACILLFMCLLLVGITLRMAPLIDEMEITIRIPKYIQAFRIFALH